MSEGQPIGGSGAMFDAIAPRYDLLNRILSLGLDQGWRRDLVRAMALAPGDHALDLATGTADVAVRIVRSQPGLRVTGLDPSAAMLAQAAAKLQRLALTERVDLCRGDAQALPFPDDHFAASCIAFGIRNVPDRALGLAEMARVTRPGGHVVVLELGEPEAGPLAHAVRFHIRQVVPRLGALLSGASEYRYLQRSVAAFPAPARFAAMMEGAGLAMDPPRSLGFGAAQLYRGRVKG
jgi:demethylmenaquinone methyltransferase/2-methoxy-6-polyprenyl-1,4-benzoquinol methylase